MGSHLVERLLDDGREVFVIDDFSTGSRDNLPLGRKGLWIADRDVRDPRVGNAVPLRCDEIYNLACPASPLHYQADAVKTLQTSVLGTLHMLDLAQAWNARLLQASTSEVYGDPEVHPQPESYCGSVNPLGPRACYDEGKRAAETLCCDYRRQYGVDNVIVRIFNTYGPRMAAADGRVVSSFVSAAIAGRPFLVAGDGKQTRSFCYVDDTIDGLVKAMASNLAGPINIGNPYEITIDQLVEAVARAARIDRPLRAFLPAAKDDPRRRQPDISMARSLLGWSPKVSLDEGLRRTVQWALKYDLPHNSAVALPA